MSITDHAARENSFSPARSIGAQHRSARPRPNKMLRPLMWKWFNYWCDLIAPCPWNAHVGLSSVGTHTGWPDQVTLRFVAPDAPAPRPFRQPLYTPAERKRRDSTSWTTVQAVLAPIQFLAFAVSLGLIVHFMVTGEGYGIATASIMIKTALLYSIMITGSIWEKVVFGRWLFAKAFFWEDVLGLLVLALQSAYLAAFALGWGTATEQMFIAMAAYAAYAVNASQFLWKLRTARLERTAADLPGLAV